MDTLKLGLVGLSSAEEALIATLFRLHRVDRSFIWSLASAPPFDALLVDIDSEDWVIAPWKARKTRLMRLGRLTSDTEGVLPRPIRSELLVRWLNSIEVEILHGARDGYATTVRESQLHTRPPSAFGSIFWRSSFLDQESGGDALHAFRVGSCSFKLRRWPMPDLLKGDVHRIRMATMLSRRHLKLHELCTLSRMPEVKCEEFVKELYKFKLLDEGGSQVSELRAGLRSTEEVPADHPQPRNRGFGVSLIASIRKRFGLL